MLPFLITGLVGGFLSGLFGVGGGLIMVPMLMWLAKLDQRRAAATSLIAVVPAAIAGTVGYTMGGRIDFLVAGLLAIGGIVGAPIGTWLLRTLSLAWLRWLFIAVLVLVAIRMVTLVPTRDDSFTYAWFEYLMLLLLGLIMGVASGLFGIGGGVIVVPVLMAFFGVSDLTAKGTSLLAMVPSSVVGTWSNLRSGMVRLNEGLLVGVAAVLASSIGVTVAFVIPAQAASLVFGIFLLGVAIRLAQQYLTERK